MPLGEITSGTFCPTLKKGIGLALLPSVVNPDAEVGVDVRGRREIFQLTKLPFVDPSVREADVSPTSRPTFRQPTPAERPGGGGSRTRRRRGGRRGRLAGQRFASQADAESWVGEIWAELAERGRRRRDALRASTAQVYGPMSLHA